MSYTQGPDWQPTDLFGLAHTIWACSKQESVGTLAPVLPHEGKGWGTRIPLCHSRSAPDFLTLD